MQISFNWLKQYVKLPSNITAREVAGKLKLSTVEVEGIINQGENLDRVVVGKIISCEKHPNADKLKVCQVDVGAATVTIVCGGSNVAAGMLVAVALNGAKVKWHGEGELIELKPATIRGVESNGMICGADEIGLGELFPKKEEKEIVDLTTGGYKPGMLLAPALGLDDVVLEIDNKSLSNRPDLWGHYGLSREVAVLFNKNLEPYQVKKIKDGKETKITVAVENPKRCSKYMAVAMSGITVQESPTWLKQRLTSVGLRPINNIVDITNYVMLDLGQPLHAFDAGQMPGGKIYVRLAKEGEKFQTLDGAERFLDNSMLVIASQQKAVAIAGVMGGEKSGITNDTASIILEAANFEATGIRQTSAKLGLRSDSSARFEKSLDPNLCSLALARAVELIQETCRGSRVSSQVTQAGSPKLFTGPINLPLGLFAQKIGIEIPLKTIVNILERLGFVVKTKKNLLVVTIPTWRATKDISLPEDIVEEVIRIFGYENIPGTLPNFIMRPPEQSLLRVVNHQMLDVLVRELGYTEVYNYSFISAEQIVSMGESTADYFKLDNPLSKEKPFLRRCLVPNLLENIKNNNSNRDEIKLVEIGKVFVKERSGLRAMQNGDELLPGQDTVLTAIYTQKKNINPFFEARRVVEAIAAKLYLDLGIIASTQTRVGRHPGRSAEIMYHDVRVGSVYELHPMVGKKYGLNERVGVARFYLDKLAELGLPNKNTCQTLAQFPEVNRDIAFLAKKEFTHAALSLAIKQIDPLITKVELFDVYEGEKVGKEYRSMAYHITYSHKDRTLTSEEVEKAQTKVSELLKKEFNAEVRS